MRSLLVAATVAGALVFAPLAAIAEPAPPPATSGEAPQPSADDVESMIQAEHQQQQRRNTQLAWHQGLAIGALVAMVTTGVVGKVLTNQKQTAEDVSALTTAHVVLGTTTTLLYGSAATLALTAPPPTQNPVSSAGFDPVVVHKGISWLHAATLGATVALGVSTLLGVKAVTPAHQALAITTTGLMALSGGLIVFNF
jgi:hypothetical protein